MPETEGYPLEAVILINTKLGDMWKVADAVRKIQDVKFANAVAGRYDVVAHVETTNLSWVIARVHATTGVTRTETLITLKARFEK